jgi:hypothetical protein
VCFDYTDVSLPDPGSASLLHFDGTAWVDVTTSNDVSAHIICGVVESLSPFVIGNEVSVNPYTVRALFDQEKVYKAGSTIPIGVQILQELANASAQTLPLVATGVRLKSTETNWGVPEDPGQSNPDLNFRFTTVDGEPGYQFNLKTTGYSTGTYELKFRVGTGENAPELVVEFQVR